MGRILRHISAKRTAQPTRESKPLLFEGQRLDQETFHRLYEASPELKRVQLIQGMVYMPSPMRFVQHGQPQAAINAWLGFYAAHTPGVRCGGSSTLKIDESNVYEPDGMLFYEKGQLVFAEDGYLQGVPELVVEVAASTVVVDTTFKFEVYESKGVKEYLLWNTGATELTWYHRTKEKFVPMNADRTGIIKSKVFSGLWLDVGAMLAFEQKAVLKTLQLGLKQQSGK